MLGHEEINDIISIITAVFFLIVNNPNNFLFILLLWYHLIRGIITYIIEYALYESYINIYPAIDILTGVFVFFRDYANSKHLLHIIMIILLIKSVIALISPFERVVGEDQ